MNVQVNRKHFADLDNILKLELREGKVFVHLKKGYPKILKARVGLSCFLLRLVNARMSNERIKELKDDKLER